MITNKVQNLFDFIDFLYGITDYLVSKQPAIDSLLELVEKRNSLKPDINFRERIEYNNIEIEIDIQMEILTNQTTKLIKDKVKELNIADLSTPIDNLNAREDLFRLKEKFCENDLKLISTAKSRYLEFRKKTGFHYFLEIFFSDLDRNLKKLFDYFKEDTDTANGFEAFETKTIQANDIAEAGELYQKGHRSFTMPIDPLNPSKAPQMNVTEAAENIKNKFNTMPVDGVRNHFKPLIERKNNKGEIWMTKEDFEIFLKRSFGLQTDLPKPKINIGSRGKFAVIKLFYYFYSKSTDHPYNGIRKKEGFVKLLKDAFENSDFNDLTNDNFKGDKSQYEWDYWVTH